MEYTQMTIFDYMAELAADSQEPAIMPDFDRYTKKEAIAAIEQKVGIKFSMDSQCNFDHWEGGWFKWQLKKGYYLDMSFTHFDTGDGRDGRRIICVGWNAKTEGGGMPAESIDEAAVYFMNALKRLKGKGK